MRAMFVQAVRDVMAELRSGVGSPIAAELRAVVDVPVTASTRDEGETRIPYDVGVPDVLKLAYDAGVAAGAAVPEGMACGRGDVMRPGEMAWANEPLLTSPFGQDYYRHEAFVRAAVGVLRRHGIPASGRVELD